MLAILAGAQPCHRRHCESSAQAADVPGGAKAESNFIRRIAANKRINSGAVLPNAADETVAGSGQKIPTPAVELLKLHERDHPIVGRAGVDPTARQKHR
jgi:hypothetical protein